jgi:hypothetical protein
MSLPDSLFHTLTFSVDDGDAEMDLETQTLAIISNVG